jgi:O-methyltransferase
MKTDRRPSATDPLPLRQRSFARRALRYLRYRLGQIRPRGAAAWYRESDETDKFRHILEAVNYIRVAQLPPTFFEFGCHSGRTFAAGLEAASHLGVSLDAYAFDSFQGLPETTREVDGIFEAGSFATSRQEFERIISRRTGVRLRADQVIEGYYVDSLTPELARRLPEEVGIVHIDVDLYSSTRTLLAFVRPFLANGTVLLFDDWFCFPPGREMGERRAATEFLAEHPTIELIEWKAYSTFGMSFFVALTDNE